MKDLTEKFVKDLFLLDGLSKEYVNEGVKDMVSALFAEYVSSFSGQEASLCAMQCACGATGFTPYELQKNSCAFCTGNA